MDRLGSLVQDWASAYIVDNLGTTSRVIHNFHAEPITNWRCRPLFLSLLATSAVIPASNYSQRGSYLWTTQEALVNCGFSTLTFGRNTRSTART